MYGVLTNGEIYIHVLVHKQGQVYGEIYIQRLGIVKIRCRQCVRWHKITIRQPGKAELEESDAPAVISEND